MKPNDITTFEPSLDVSKQFSLTLFEAEHTSSQLLAQILLFTTKKPSSIELGLSIKNSISFL